MSAGSVEPAPAREALRGHAALFAVQLCFGLFPVFGKWVLESLSPFALAAWRVSFGALAMTGIALALHGRRLWPGWRDLALLALASLLGVSANQLLYLSGLARSSAVEAGLVMCLIPVFTFVLAALAGQERFAPSRGFGIALAFAGALWWIARERPELVRRHALGDGLMVANTLCYAGYLVLTKPIARRQPPLVVMAWVYLFALPVVPLVAAGERFVPAGAPARTWASLAYVLVFPTVVAYLLNVYALARLRASTTAVYVYLQPLVSGAGGALLLGEELTSAVAIAALFVFAGIALVSRRPPAAALPDGGAAR